MSRVLARHTLDARELEADNPSCVGGDISGGLMDWRQLLFRPVPRLGSYTTGVSGIDLCSSAKPPGGGCTACAAIMPHGRRSRVAGDRTAGGEGQGGGSAAALLPSWRHIHLL